MNNNNNIMHILSKAKITLKQNCWCPLVFNLPTFHFLGKQLFRCVRCPTAYHVGDCCIAAGSIHLAGYSIVCSRHFQPMKTLAHHAHVNVAWCFICNKGRQFKSLVLQDIWHTVNYLTSGINGSSVEISNCFR